MYRTQNTDFIVFNLTHQARYLMLYKIRTNSENTTTHPRVISILNHLNTLLYSTKLKFIILMLFSIIK